MDENPTDTRLRQLLIAAVVLIVVFCIYTLVSSFITYYTTGIVHISSSDPKATISIGQINHEAKAVGTGKASVRLKPGTYQAMASSNRNQVVKTVVISVRQSVDSSLKPTGLPAIRSVDDVEFDGMGVFLESGRTEDQISAIELDFFRFKPSARNVTVDGDSYTPGPRNARNHDPFNATFDVTIDSKPYKAKIIYSGLNNIDMLIYNPDGSVAFDSNSNTSKAPVEKSE